MKTTLLALIAAAMMIPAISSAKVEDFNAMIGDNAKEQKQLQTELNNNSDSAHQAQHVVPRKANETLDIADNVTSSVNSPTTKSTLLFEKEMVHYRPSEDREMKRLAEEVKAADSSF